MPRACRDDDTAKTSDVCSISARVSATRRCVGELALQWKRYRVRHRRYRRDQKNSPRACVRLRRTRSESIRAPLSSRYHRRLQLCRVFRRSFFQYLRTSRLPACSLSPSIAERMRAMLLRNELALSAAFVLTLVVHPEIESHNYASFLTSISRSQKRLCLADLL